MSGILGKLFGAPKPDGPVATDLMRLDQIRAGLGRAATAYVETGVGGEVLSTLGAVDVAGTLKLSQRQTVVLDDQRRGHALARHLDPARFVRYAEVLAAGWPAGNERLAGTDAVPLVLRVGFAEAGDGVVKHRNRWPRELIAASECALSPGACREIAERAGGSIADIFDILFHESGTWYSASDILRLKDIHDFGPLAAAHPDAVIAAGRRIGAKGKAALLIALRGWGLVERPVLRDFVVEMASDGSKAVRAEAINALSTLPPKTLLPVALERLRDGTVAQREAMVALLAGLGTPDALDALRAHAGTERTARVRSAIDTALAVAPVARPDRDGEDDETGYVALDGTRIEIPPIREPGTGPQVTFGPDDVAALTAIIDDLNAETERKRKEWKRKAPFYASAISRKLAQQSVDALNQVGDGRLDREIARFLIWTAKDWTKAMFDRLPENQAVRLAMAMSQNRNAVWLSHGNTASDDALMAYVQGPRGDYRVIERHASAHAASYVYGGWHAKKSREYRPGDILREQLFTEYSWISFEDLPGDALWPYLATRFDVLDEAFGLTPGDEAANKRPRAIRFLAHMPKPPQRYFGPLLELATGTGKTGRAEARAMLAGAPGLIDRVLLQLDDTRQEVRAGAALWLADLKAPEAARPLRARLSKEKSDLARAAILSALSKMGEDLSDYVGPDALAAEAEKTLKKARLDRLDWLLSPSLPKVAYRDGTPVPETVLKAWIHTADKLKQPGGNALFGIYLDQLAPDDAMRFSTWILDAWIAYDTTRMAHDEAQAIAERDAPARHQAYKKWYSEFTLEDAKRQIYNEVRSNFPNSGAASKGILGLTQKASASHAAAQVRAYLKEFGARTSQTTALLEMMAGRSDPLALQVVLAAATRLKQKSVQARAGQLVEAIAADRQWSVEELADRTIPTAGLNDDGILELPVGPAEKVYVARIDDDLKLALFNPDGKPVKALPSGDDEATAASKKALTAAKREVKQVAMMQGDRLYEALCATRFWPVEDWRRDFSDHPLMGRLTERVIWLGLDADGTVQGAFRPTAEGDIVNAEDDPVDLSDFAAIRLAHGALLGEDAAEAWARHLADYEVKPLFRQFGRPLLSLDGLPANATAIDDRRGWVTDTFTFRGVATKLGYERGEALDGGYFNQYVKTFPSAGLAAVIEFSGNALPEENVPAAQIELRFVGMRNGRMTGRAVPLKEVPPVLLSECWNDYRDMVAKGTFDPDWKSKMPWI